MPETPSPTTGGDFERPPAPSPPFLRFLPHRRGCAVIFSAEHETQIREFNGVEQALRHADLERELSLAFHPIVDVEAGLPRVMSSFRPRARKASYSARTLSRSAWSSAFERSAIRFMAGLDSVARAGLPGFPSEIGFSRLSFHGNEFR